MSERDDRRTSDHRRQYDPRETIRIGQEIEAPHLEDQQEDDRRDSEATETAIAHRGDRPFATAKADEPVAGIGEAVELPPGAGERQRADQQDAGDLLAEERA